MRAVLDAARRDDGLSEHAVVVAARLLGHDVGVVDGVQSVFYRVLLRAGGYDVFAACVCGRA